MIRFAHASDVHLGFQRDPALQEMELSAFCSMMDGFVERKVDFALLPGDVFHTNVPRMKVQKHAFEAFRRVHEAGIPIYVVYGSHDFSPVSDSVIDLLAAAGYVKKVMLLEDDGERINLGFVQDPKTGAKITGLFGLKQGKDENWYKRLDVAPLEKEDGFKIFLFHGAVAEMNEDEDAEKIPMSMFPKGFDYYAGGHMHKRQHYSQEGYPHVVYPGTPFAGFHADMEDTARGEKRGYYVVECDGTKTKSDGNAGCRLEFVELPALKYQIVSVNADGMDPDSVTKKVLKWLENFDARDMVVIIKVSGQMQSGKVSEIDSAAIARAADGAIACMVKTGGLTSDEYDIIESIGESRDEIIQNVFAENAPQFHTDEKPLAGDAGIRTATALLRILEKPKPEGQTKSDYDGQIVGEAMEELKLP